MQTASIVEANPVAAWLESTPREGREPLRAEVTQLPFTIGRNETCDLTLESARVSREHSRIYRGASGYMVSDLSSTNGTFINGVKVKDSPLADGDLLTVANFGLIFHSPKDTARQPATQCFTSSGDSQPAPAFAAQPDAQHPALKLIETLRGLQELSLHRGVRTRLQAIVKIASNEPVGYELGTGLFSDVDRLPFEQRIPDDLHCRAVVRVHELGRSLAVERAWSLFGDVRLFLSVTERELGNADFLDSLERIKQRSPGESATVIQLPHPALADLERLIDVRSQLREIGMAVALSIVGLKSTELDALHDDPPEYIKLSPSIVQALGRSPEQRRDWQTLLQATQERAIQVIACGVKGEAEWQACKNLEIPLVQGEFVAAAMPLDACGSLKRSSATA